MLTDLPSKQSLTECLQAMKEDEEMTANEICRLQSLSKEQDLQFVLPTIEALEKKLRSLAKQKGHMQNQLNIIVEREEAENDIENNLTTNIYDEEEHGTREEGALVEQYGNEVRTTFVMRSDMLRLRISNDIDATMYDSFEKGRPDCLHTYSSVEAHHRKMTFFPGRSDKVRTYTRELVDYQWTFTLVHHDDCDVLQRRVTLVADKDVAPLLDTPTSFRAKVAAVEIVKAGEPERIHKSYVLKRARVWATDPCVSKDDDATKCGEGQELYTFHLGDDDVCCDIDTGVNATTDPTKAKRQLAAAHECYEDVLLHERQTLQLILGFERYFHQFQALHAAGVEEKRGRFSIGRLADSMPDRVAALSGHIESLYTTLDTADVKAARAMAEKDAVIAQLRKELAIATYDPAK